MGPGPLLPGLSVPLPFSVAGAGFPRLAPAPFLWGRDVTGMGVLLAELQPEETSMFSGRANRRSFLASAAVAAAAMSLPNRAAAADSPQRHIVLFGDSILDNAAYVDGGPDVVSQLRTRLPAGSKATLAAIDGSVASAVRLQLKTAPHDATHLVVSAGGNDALRCINLLTESAGSVAEALGRLAVVREQFTEDYSALLDDVVARGLPAAVCTVYDARLPDMTERRIASVGLTIFNECITREASARGLALIDLRLICRADQDLATPIEPSVVGGAKIADAIAAFAADYDRNRGRSEVFPGAGIGL